MSKFSFRSIFGLALALAATKAAAAGTVSVR